jgi:hypothetical protein
MLTEWSHTSAMAVKVFGNLNYVFNLLPYYEIDSLNTYPSVNPANDYGQDAAHRVVSREAAG